MNWTSFRARKGRQVGDVVLWGKGQGSRVKVVVCFVGASFLFCTLQEHLPTASLFSVFRLPIQMRLEDQAHPMKGHVL
jgi:hypothetical protein